MPVPYLKKLAQRYKIPIKELEHLWEKAKSLGEEHFPKEENWAYIVGVMNYRP